MKLKYFIYIILFLFSASRCCYADNAHNSKRHNKVEKNTYMKRLRQIKGPIFSGYYNYVHIVSKSVGVYAYGPAVITNSIIESPICVVSDGNTLQMHNNILNCKLCIKFEGGVLVNNDLSFNDCAGIFTNRPDIFND